MLRFTTIRRSLLIAAISANIFFVGAPRAATKPLDLDGNAANGAESQCDLNVLQTFPVMIENRITNKSGGDAFSFDWPSAGPGGFKSSVPAGTAGGVGAKWVWTTNQSVYSYTGSSCTTDVCFSQTGGPDSLTGFCSDACLADGTSVTITKGATAGTVELSWVGGQSTFTIYRATSKIGIVAPANSIGTTNTPSFTDIPPANTTVFYVVRGVDCASRAACTTNSDCSAPGYGTCVHRGPFGVPGRSLLATNVTVSAASLTSSLITFFSPPTEIFRATSSGFAETVTNTSTHPVTVTLAAYPTGCCPANPDIPHPLRCGETCVDYLNDPANCGSCGNVCGDGNCCSNGNCASLCGEGQSWCDGQCVDLQNDNGNCGACGNTCGDGTCCNGGTCESFCPAGQVLCGELCVDFENDSGNCGACGIACGDGSCCNGGTCVSLCGEGQVWCDGQCADLQNDSGNCGACGNACEDGACCNAGACASVCGAGRTYCGGLCYDTLKDPSNCGSCGNVCGDDTVCSGGACVPCSGQGGARDACDNRCVNLNTDPYNCGACGVSCNEGCPSGFKGVCSNGQSCRCVAGTPAPQPPSGIPPPTAAECPNPHPSPGPTGGVCPNPNPSSPVLGTCPNPAPSTPVPGVCPDPGPPAPTDETPTCVLNEATQTLPPGGSATTCHPSGVLFKEIATEITVCGDGIPGVDGTCNNATTKITTGTFNRLVPDPTKSPGIAFVTPYAVHITSDTSNDGLLEPGESADMVVDLLNPGSMNITQVSATLSAPSIDLSDDGEFNPIGISVGTASAAYGTIPGTPVSADCTASSPHPASNATVFSITVPVDHPGDTSHPIVLSVIGTVDGGPFAMDVPIALGIADRCDAAAFTRDFDGLDGLSSPMAKLVPEGDQAPFPSNAFVAGNTRPLKLRVSCGGVNLTDATVDPPEIVGLSEATRGALDIQLLNLNADSGTNPNDPFFRFNNNVLSGGQWNYNVRTALLGRGSFTLTVRIAGRKRYVTGFELE